MESLFETGKTEESLVETGKARKCVDVVSRSVAESYEDMDLDNEIDEVDESIVEAVILDTWPEIAEDESDEAEECRVEVVIGELDET